MADVAPAAPMSRAVKAVVGAQTFLALGNLATSLLALYMTQRLGMSEVNSGLFLGACAIASALAALLAVQLSDRWGARLVAVRALVVAGLGWILTPYCGPLWAILGVLLITQALDNSTAVLINTLVADADDDRADRKRSFSLLYAASSVGHAVSPLSAGLLFEYAPDMAFVGTGLATLAAAWLISLLDPHQHRPSTEAAAAEGESAPSLRLLPLPLLLFSVLFIAHGLTYSQTGFALPLWLASELGDHAPRMYGLLMTANGVLVLLMLPLATRFTAGLAPGKCVGIGLGLYALAFVGYGHALNLGWLFASMAVWTAGEVLVVPNAKVFVAEAVPEWLRTRANTLLDFSFEAGFGLGPVAAGFVLNRGGQGLLWPLIATTALACGLGIATVEKRMLRRAKT